MKTRVRQTMIDHSLDFLATGGAMGQRILSHDWSGNPIGPPRTWPAALRTAVSLILASRFPQAIVWGPQLITIYNDAFVPILAGVVGLGQPFDEICSEDWGEIAPICDAAFQGQATFIENYPIVADRGTAPRQAWFTFCYSPIRDEHGKVAGMLDTVIETTETMLALAQRRRLTFLDDLARAVQSATDPNAILAITTQMTAEHLGVSHCSYADMDSDADGFTIRGDWTAAGSSSIVGHYSLADFGERAVESLSAGKPLIIHDILAELSPEEAATFQTIGIAATICIPLVKDGRLTALMAVHDKAPRAWSDYDLSVIEDVTTRSWAHVERVRAEDHLRRAQEAGGVGLFAIDIESDIVHATVEFCRIFGVPPSPRIPASELEALVLPEDRRIVSNREKRRSAEAPVDVEYRIRRPDTGEVRTLSRRAEYEHDWRGKPVRMLGAVRDITEQRKAQRALEESQAKFRMLAEAVPSMVWTAPAGHPADWYNERIYKYCGLSPGELADEAWADMVHPDDLAATNARWAASRDSGDIFEAEFRLRRHDGVYRWHLGRAVAVRDEEGALVRWVGANTDIHDRMVAGAETARDRERMWAMSQDLLLVCDASGVITDVNPTATRLLGWAADQMIGHSILDFIHPDDRAASAAEIERAANGASALAFENRYRTSSGDYLLLDWTAVPDGDRIHGVGRDITESRSIARDQERIWTLSPVVKIMTSPDGSMLKVNPAWTATLGWSAADTTGRHLAEFVDERDRDKAGAAIERVMMGESLSDQEWAFDTSEGGTRQIAWSFVAENDYIFGFGRDITEQRIAEEALRQSQKMEAVGQLTGGIAHDFNNLLQGVTGNLELLQHRVDQGRIEGIERFIKGASTSANRASALTHRLLAFSRRQPLDPRAVRANPLVSSMEDMLRRTLSETIHLELVLAGGLWLTKCDPNQLESAILNLAINARDAMPEGGTLTIETCNAHLDNAYAARQRDIAAGQYVCISVSDTGVGMDAEIVSRAFEPFFTTKPIGQGTGLGLSMIYGFARQSEGYAKIYSEPGKGTTIKLYLPRYRGAAEANEETPHLTADLATDSGETVLVVEDEPVVRGLIVEVLSELGYRAIEAVDGPSGLQVLQSDRRIDLLVTDIGLPGLNGRQVADAGRVSRPGLKVLFMTGYAENAALASGFLEPGMAMITKPFAMEALASRIREMIGSG